MNQPTMLNADHGIPLLKEAALRGLFAAGLVSQVMARGVKDGFVLEVMINGGAALLASSRGEERKFAALETIALLLRRLGTNEFVVNVASYEPGRTRAPQPERSKVMKAGQLFKAKK